MRVYNKDEYLQNENIIIKAIADGAVYVHPTDTIYGIGCDATNPRAARRVREAKQQYNQPFSVIVPGKQWIREHCIVGKEAEKWLEKLPGPYTLILKLKKKTTVDQEVLLGKNTIGVRIPNHWIHDLAIALNKPLVTTSANAHGKTFMTTIDNLSQEIASKTDLAIYEGPRHGSPSTIIDLTGQAKVIRKPRLLHIIAEKGRLAAQHVKEIGKRITASLRRKA